MKFTKEQLLDALKAKLTANGKHLSISEKTIKNLSDSHYDLLVNEDTELDDLLGRLLPQYVSLNGNYEKDNADFIKKWKEDHPEITPPKPSVPPAPPAGDLSPEIKALKEEVRLLKEKDAEREVAKKISAKRSELLAMFKEKGIKDEKWIEKYLGKLPLSEDTDIEKETTDALDFYNLARSHGGLTPKAAESGTDNRKNDAERWKGVNKVLGTNNPKA